ncbi:MAG: chemotaxis-specific protein-glutamate methyltransferase CheB [Planctomycetes bacterium]|nr:chemotaxis-specific protein-glutamate methyltransferase CheB [Planctomycetota bacterium]
MQALVVDDSRAMRRMLGRYLGELGFVVAEADNGRQALDRLAEIPVPALLLVDWNMPEMNGLELVKAVRADKKFDGARIMMVTTESGADRVGDALACGANEYLMKPFTQDALRDKVELLGFAPSVASRSAPAVTPAVPAGDKFKVLLVDDSAVVRRLVGAALQEEPDIELETAENGSLALDKVASWSPDIVILDIEMPVMDGLTALSHLRQKWRQLPVVMFSTLTERGASVTLSALAAGASAYITKPSGHESIGAALGELRRSLVDQIHALCRRPGRLARPQAAAAPPAPVITTRPAPQNRIDAILIASSTGGPVALAEVVPRLPADLPVPVLIVQHMPELFTAMLAKSLDGKSPLAVREGHDGATVARGEVWLAPGGLHMEVRRQGGEVRLVTHDGPREQSVRPAADVLFRSAVEVYGGNLLAVVLTGMGRDALAGCEVVAGAGGQILAQDEATSVVWGMPGFVARANLANAVLPLDRIADEITARVARAPALSGRVLPR